MGANEGYDEVQCTCGQSFKTFGEYLTHCYAVHHLTAEQAGSTPEE